MKSKAIATIIVTMLLAFSAFDVLPVKAQQYLKIGIIGPVGRPHMTGMAEGAALAANWINGPGGGIVIDGTRYDVSLSLGDDHSFPPNPNLGAAEMERLITQEQCDIILGGFSLNCLRPIREVAMSYQKLFFIAGDIGTNELIDCGTGTCGACVRCNYARYKYLFGVNFNQTTLLKNLAGFLRGYGLPYRLAPLYGVQLDGDPELDIKTAVIAEDLPWAVDKYNAIVYEGILGPHANIVYNVFASGPDFSSYLDDMHAAQVRLIVHLFSTTSSAAFISQWAAHPIKAIPVGIDALGQLSDFWSWTAGKCQYETLLAASGTRTPISTTSQPYKTTEFWDLYYTTYGHPPIYTSFGAYDTLIAMHDRLEAQAGPTYIHPPFDTADANALVPLIEATNRESTLGRFKYTGPHPTVPGAMLHDVFSNEYGPTWIQHYARPLIVQWQAGRLEIVWPMDQPYSKLWVLPNEIGKMYPYPTDINQDGKVDTSDVSAVGYAYGSYPGHPRWQFAADVDDNRFIDGNDLVMVCWDFGKTVDLPLQYCDEAGHMSR